MGMLKMSAIALVAAVGMQVGVHYVPKLLLPKVPTTVYGTWTHKYEPVINAFRKNLEVGYEKGGALSVYQDGALVCDIWGGYKDYVSLEPWQENTMSVYFSATKGIAAIALLILYDRGLLDYDKPVAHYWPEFGKNGKERITVKQLVSHQAGLAWIQEPFNYTEIKSNPEKIERILAEAKPTWVPGAGHGYHAMSLGLYMDQLIRRIDPKHRSIGQFVKDEIAKPLDIDFYIGTPTSEHYRIATWQDKTISEGLHGLLFVPGILRMTIKLLAGSDPIFKGTITNPVIPQGYLQTTEARETEMASVMGIGTARAVAKIYGVVSNGGKYNGKQFLSEKAISRYNEGVSTGIDKILGLNYTWGYGVGQTTLKQEMDAKVIGHLGFGGQIGHAVPKKGLGLAYVTNYHSMYYMGLDDPRFIELLDILYKCAG